MLIHVLYYFVLSAVNSIIGLCRLLEKVSMNHKFIGTDALDLMKFICKEFWEEVFRKKVSLHSFYHNAHSHCLYSSFVFFCLSCQIDKLQTNHRGVFVLSDTKFKWLERYSSDDIESKQAAERLLHFPCGMLRGALANLGVLALVNADFNTLPACTFNIRVKT